LTTRQTRPSPPTVLPLTLEEPAPLLLGDPLPLEASEQVQQPLVPLAKPLVLLPQGRNRDLQLGHVLPKNINISRRGGRLSLSRRAPLAAQRCPAAGTARGGLATSQGGLADRAQPFCPARRRGVWEASGVGGRLGLDGIRHGPRAWDQGGTRPGLTAPLRAGHAGLATGRVLNDASSVLYCLTAGSSLASTDAFHRAYYAAWTDGRPLNPAGYLRRAY
jgi:hypothetical protein